MARMYEWFCEWCQHGGKVNKPGPHPCPHCRRTIVHAR